MALGIVLQQRQLPREINRHYTLPMGRRLNHLLSSLAKKPQKQKQKAQPELDQASRFSYQFTRNTEDKGSH